MIADASFTAILTLVGLAFIPALAHKLRDPGAFTRTVREYQLLPGALAQPAAIFLVIAELSTVALIAGSFVLWRTAGENLPGRLGLAAAGSLLVLYGLAMLVNLARKRLGLDCGCSGGNMPISGGLVLRNFGLALLAWGGVMIGAAGPQTLALGVAAGIALFLGYQTSTRILSNRLMARIPGNDQ